MATGCGLTARGGIGVARGDTAYALDQVVSATDSAGSFTVVRRYRVSSAGCVWLPTHRTPVTTASPR